MPFYDFSSNSGWLPGHYDCCIIGAGAAGILLACRLGQKGKNILLVESGHFVEDEQRQNLNEVIQSGKPLTSAGWGRKRAIGGTTIAWGGQSLPFSELDFEKRDWVQNSGWPFSKYELDEYYRKANKFMGIDSLGFDEEIFSMFKLNKIKFDDEMIMQHFSKWAPEPNFRVRHEKSLRESIELIYNAQVTEITFLEAGKKIAISINGFNGEVVEITIPKLVLATGGIETNRILLSNRHQYQKGIGNHSGWLGKCFMEHPCMEVGILTNVNAPYNFQKNFNTHRLDDIRYSPKLSLSKRAQTNNSLLNASTSFLFEYPNGVSPYAELKEFLKTKKVINFFKASAKTPSLLKSTLALLCDKFYYKHNAVPKMGVMLEQEPLTESCIRLSSSLDRFGQPKAEINWVISELTWKTGIWFMEAIKSELKRLQIGTLVLSENFNLQNRNWLKCLTDVNHHMGGTRISNVPAKGVVNTHCQIWGHENLYIASASAFPTSSHSNPTLTILALAERIAEHIGASS